MKLKSNKETLTLRKLIRIHKSLRYRGKWKRFSGCEVCNSKLMAYLENGHTYEEVKQKLHEKHPEIKYIDQYSRNAIRSATGMGLWDDWIYEHNFWTLRSPLLIKKYADNPTDQRKLLEEMWAKRAEKGRYLIEMDRKAHEVLDRGDEIAELMLYAMNRVKFSGVHS